MLAELADPSDYPTHENQLILAKQLIEHGANVNAASIPMGRTPLLSVCHAGNVTNLDFVELLLKAGADPNAPDHEGRTPLMRTTPVAPGAAKFLLNWPATDVNFTDRSGESFLTMVRLTVKYFSAQIALPATVTPTGSKTNSSSSSGATSNGCDGALNTGITALL
jgi:hypothetical protein